MLYPLTVTQQFLVVNIFQKESQRWTMLTPQATLLTILKQYNYTRLYINMGVCCEQKQYKLWKQR